MVEIVPLHGQLHVNALVHTPIEFALAIQHGQESTFFIDLIRSSVLIYVTVTAMLLLPRALNFESPVKSATNLAIPSKLIIASHPSMKLMRRRWEESKAYVSANFCLRTMF